MVRAYPFLISALKFSCAAADPQRIKHYVTTILYKLRTKEHPADTNKNGENKDNYVTSTLKSRIGKSFLLLQN